MLVSLFDYLSICRRYGSSTASCLLRGKPKSKIQYCTGYVTGRERVRGRKKRKKLELKTRVAFNAYILSLSTLMRVRFILPAIIDTVVDWKAVSLTQGREANWLRGKSRLLDSAVQ